MPKIVPKTNFLLWSAISLTLWFVLAFFPISSEHAPCHHPLYSLLPASTSPTFSPVKGRPTTRTMILTLVQYLGKDSTVAPKNRSSPIASNATSQVLTTLRTCAPYGRLAGGA